MVVGALVEKDEYFLLVIFYAFRKPAFAGFFLIFRKEKIVSQSGVFHPPCIKQFDCELLNRFCMCMKPSEFGDRFCVI